MTVPIRCATLDDLMSLPVQLDAQYYIAFDQWSFFASRPLYLFKRNDVVGAAFIIEDPFTDNTIHYEYSRGPFGIINKYLASDSDRDLLLCQDELIDAGYAEWARL